MEILKSNSMIRRAKGKETSSLKHLNYTTEMNVAFHDTLAKMDSAL